MPQIMNAGSAYLSLGSGQPLLKIYDNANIWIQLGGSDTYDNVVFFHNNGNGTAQLTGYVFSGTFNLPNGFVANGNQSFTANGGNISTTQSSINDGSNVMNLGTTTNSANLLTPTCISWTINIRSM